MVFPDLRRFILVSLLLPSIAVTGCRSGSGISSGSSPVTQVNSPSGKQIKVVTTFLPMYLFTKAVTGDAAKVDILIKPGTEVHEYQSTPANVQAIAQANVVVKNGLGIDSFLDSTLKSAENSKLTVVNASKGIQPIEETSTIEVINPDKQDSTGESMDAHDHKGNPHVWLDPLLAKKQVENIRDGLVAADPAHEKNYRANAAVYIQKLTDLDNQFVQGLKSDKQRTFVTFHDAFPYLARRYQLQQLAVVSIPEDQLSPGDVQKTIAAVKKFKVKALFSEPGIDNKLLTGISKDLNLTVYPLDSLEAGQLEPNYYFTAMKANLKTLETAFN